MDDVDPTIDSGEPEQGGQQQSFDLGAAFAPDLAGRQLGRYRIKRLIATGGMGSVYEAIQDQPRRTVAVKVMKPGLASRSALRRFEYESQLLARLRHPGIAEVYEAGTHDEHGVGVPYFVMEYISRAKRVTDYVREKKLDTRQRLELFVKVCQAVHHGHTKGIIHRDLKPDNILIDSHGQPKVIDFGVARATDSDMAVATLQTDIGQLIGTLQYMSPEQVDADPHDLDTRSDVYSLGVVLYELLCEKLPYDVTKAQVYEATRIIREQQAMRLSTVDATLRGDVETMVVKALEKDRERRYQSAQELAADIRRYLDNEPISAHPPSLTYQLRIFARRNRALIGGVVAVFVALCIGLVATSVMFFRAEDARREAVQAQAVAERKTAEAQQQRDLASEQSERTRAERARADANAARAQLEAARAEEQRQQAEVLKEVTRRQLYISDMNRASQAYEDGDIDHMHDLLANHIPKTGEADLRGFEWYYWWRARDLDQREFRNLTTGPFKRLAVSPDGRTVAATGFPHSVYVFDVAALSQNRRRGQGQELRLLSPPLEVGGEYDAPVFSPDGAFLLVAGSSSSRVRVFTTGDWRLTETLDLPGATESLAFSPTEPLLVTGGSHGQVGLWNTTTWERLATWPAGGPVRSLAFAPDGSSFAAGVEHKAVIWDVATHKVVRTLDAHEQGVTSVVFSPNGDLLATGSEDQTVRLWDQQLAPIDTMSTLAPISSLAFSVDGKRLAAGTATNNSVLVWNMEQHPPSLIATVKGHARRIHAMAFVGDSNTVWSASDDGFIKVWDLSRCTPYEIASNTSGMPLAYAVGDRTLSPDGKLSVELRRPEFSRSTVWDITTDPPTSRYELEGWGPELCAVFSPDSALLAIGSYNNDIRLHDANSGALVHTLRGHADEVFSVAFSPDGSRVVSGSKDGTVRIWDPAVGELLSTLTGHAADVRSVAFAPDGASVASRSSDRVVRIWDARPAYVEEGSARLLPGLDERVRQRTATMEDFELRGRIHARHGAWERAVADFDRAALVAAEESDVPSAFQTPWWIVGDYPGDLIEPFAPETNPDPFEPVERPTDDQGESEMAAWGTVVFPKSGVLNLGAYCKHGQNVTAYALTKFYVHRERRDEFLVACDDQVRLWLNGKLLHERAGPRSLGAGDDVVEVTLKPGWNTLLAKVVSATGNHELSVHLGDDPIEVAEAYERADQWPAALERWTEALDAASQDVRIRLRRAGAALEANNNDLAVEDFALVMEHMDDKMLARRLVAREYTKHLNASAPLEMFSQAVNQVSEHSALRVRRAEAYIRHRRWEEAAADLARALEMSPGDLDAIVPVVEQLVSRPLISTSDTLPVEWRYTLREPAQGWQNEDFEDTDWKNGLAPFGSWGDANTPWRSTNPDIWLRKEFVLSERDTYATLVLRAFPDDNAEVYLNGVPVATVAWVDIQYQLQYQQLPCAEVASRSLRLGKNVLAVHGHNEYEEARIDVGLYGRDPSAKSSLLGILSRALQTHPDSLPLLTKRGEEYVRREMWNEAAADFLKIVEIRSKTLGWSNDPNWNSQRSRFLQELTEEESLFDAIRRHVPEESDFWLARGRNLALRSDWVSAAEAFARYEESLSPESEIWFEIAGLRKIVGDELGYRDLLSRFLQQAAENPSPFSAFVLARTMGLAPQDPQLARRAVDWGKLSLSDGSNGWYLNALGMAHFRSGSYELAAQVLQEALATGWSPPQNQLALALVAHANRQPEEAKRWLTLARTWVNERLEQAVNGRVDVQVIDWLAVHVLLHEAEARIDGNLDEPSR